MSLAIVKWKACDGSVIYSNIALSVTVAESVMFCHSLRLLGYLAPPNVERHRVNLPE